MRVDRLVHIPPAPVAWRTARSVLQQLHRAIKRSGHLVVARLTFARCRVITPSGMLRHNEVNDVRTKPDIILIHRTELRLQQSLGQLPEPRRKDQGFDPVAGHATIPTLQLLGKYSRARLLQSWYR